MDSFCGELVLSTDLICVVVVVAVVVVAVDGEKSCCAVILLCVGLVAGGDSPPNLLGFSRCILVPLPKNGGIFNR